MSWLDWLGVGVAAWIALSLPLGILVARCIHTDPTPLPGTKLPGPGDRPFVDRRGRYVR